MVSRHACVWCDGRVKAWLIADINRRAGSRRRTDNQSDNRAACWAARHVNAGDACDFCVAAVNELHDGM